VATDLLLEAYRLSIAHHLWALATRCADTLSGVYFDSGDLVRSQEWQNLADDVCQSLTSHWTNRTVAHQRIRLAAHCVGASAIDAEFVYDYTKIVYADRLTIRRQHDLAALAMLAVAQNRISDLAELVPELSMNLDACKGQRRVDYILAATIIGRRELKKESFSDAEARTLCADLRSSTLPPPWYLAAALNESAQSLFPYYAPRVETE
jgi:hypothetical protein